MFERRLAVGHVNLSRACRLCIALDERKLNYDAKIPLADIGETDEIPVKLRQ
jgi:hypothetical protein